MLNAKQIAVIPVQVDDFVDVVTVTLVNPEKFGLTEHELSSILAPAVSAQAEQIGDVVSLIKKLARVKGACERMFWLDESVVFNQVLGIPTQEWAIGVEEDFAEYFGTSAHMEGAH